MIQVFFYDASQDHLSQRRRTLLATCFVDATTNAEADAELPAGVNAAWTKIYLAIPAMYVQLFEPFANTLLSLADYVEMNKTTVPQAMALRLEKRQAAAAAAAALAAAQVKK